MSEVAKANELLEIFTADFMFVDGPEWDSRPNIAGQSPLSGLDFLAPSLSPEKVTQPTQSSETSPVNYPLSCGDLNSAAGDPRHTARSTRPSNRTKRSRSPNHVRRPRNAFMIYRSEFYAQQKIIGRIEHDHRHISRIVAHCWNRLPPHEKKIWQEKALEEKAEHALKYPDYRFKPLARTHKAVKRKVKRNSAAELDRCRKVAELLLEGKQGQELETAIKSIDDAMSPPTSPTSTGTESSSSPGPAFDISFLDSPIGSQTIPDFNSLPSLDLRLDWSYQSAELQNMAFPSDSYQSPFMDTVFTEYRSHFQMPEDQQAPVVRSPQSQEYDERLFPARQDTSPMADSSSLLDFLFPRSPPDEESDTLVYMLPSDYHQVIGHAIPYYAVQPPLSPGVNAAESSPLGYTA